MFEVFLIALCLCINALLAGAETAFIAVNKYTLREMVHSGQKKAKMLLDMKEAPERTLSVIQIGITFIGACAAAIGGSGAEESLAPWLRKNWSLGNATAELLSIFCVVVPLTYLSVVIGELVPKTLALRRSISFALASSPWLHYAGKIISPLVDILEWSTKKVIQFFPKKHTQPEDGYIRTSDNISAVTLSDTNRQYVLNVLKLEKTSVRDICIPWSEVVSIDATASWETVDRVIIASGHTRLPVLEDRKIKGILNTKQFYALEKAGSSDWPSIVRPALQLQEKIPLLTALRLMQDKRSHMAIVYSGDMIQGIITMESIFEEIIGDIYDENDNGEIKRILSLKERKK